MEVTDNKLSLTVGDPCLCSVTQECWVEDITYHMLIIQTTDGTVIMTAAVRLVEKQPACFVLSKMMGI